MDPREFARLLRQVRDERGLERAALLADRLVEALALPWIDAEMNARAREALAQRAGARLPTTPWAAAPLRVGETWLLLFHPDSGKATAARVRVVQEGAADDPFGAEGRALIEVARAGLLATVGAACRALSDEILRPSFEVPLAYGFAAEVSGGSLGVSVCAAMLSRALGRPPAANVAASAVVDRSGALRNVSHLGEKLHALRAGWPHVDSVLVAKGQTLEGHTPAGVRLIECETLLDALTAFGLDPRELPHANLEAHLTRLGTFDAENRQVHTSERWRALALSAWESANALRSERGQEKNAATAATWAALFALHAGAPDEASAYLRAFDVSASSLPPALAAWQAVVGAALKIDQDPKRAVVDARSALALAEALPEADSAVRGQAVGTLGRALLHAGEIAEAERWLARAMEFHHAHWPVEEARSRCYLATCLRKAGRAAYALACVDQGIAATQEHGRWTLSRTTRVYLELERGRCLLELGRAEAAAEAFAWVRRQQESDSEYPRLAAVRGLSSALRAQGCIPEADAALEVCVRVARAKSPGVLARAAAAAVGDVLRAQDAVCTVPRGELEALWEQAFGMPATPDRVVRVMDRWVY